MKLGDKLAAWWAAWKFVVILAAALAASLYGNWIQLKRSITADLRAENAALTDALAVNAQLSRERQEYDAKVFATLDRIQTGMPKQVVRYIEVAAKAPLDEKCAPGQARVDAVNAMLGADGSR